MGSRYREKMLDRTRKMVRIKESNRGSSYRKSFVFIFIKYTIKCVVMRTAVYENVCQRRV